MFDNQTDTSGQQLNNTTYTYQLSHQYKLEHESTIKIIVTIFYIIILVTGLIGNIITCIVIKKNQSMHTPTNYYLFSLAISDLILLISGIPYELFLIWDNSDVLQIFNDSIILCMIRCLIAEISATATVLTITAFSVERYVAICYPFLIKTLSNLKRAIRSICCIWILAVFMSIPQVIYFCFYQHLSEVNQNTILRAIFWHSFEISSILLFFLPMLIILILYVLIGIKLYKTNSLNKPNNYNSFLRRMETKNAICRKNYQNETNRVLKMLVAIVITFFICWAPFHAQRLIYINKIIIFPNNSNTRRIVLDLLSYGSGVFYYLSTCINPFLYNLMSKKFREAFKLIFMRRELPEQKPPEDYTKRSRRKSLTTQSGLQTFELLVHNNKDYSVIQPILLTNHVICNRIHDANNSRNDEIHQVTTATDDSQTTEVTQV